MRFRRIAALAAAVTVLFTGAGNAYAFEEGQEYFAQMGGRAGYEDMTKRSQTEGRQALYRDLEALAVKVWESSADYSQEQGYYVMGKLPFDGYGLSSEEAIEVYYTFRNDNPLFYFLSTTIAYTPDTLWVVTEDECVSGEARQGFQEKITGYISGKQSFLSRVRSPYVAALLLHNALCSEMEYAYDSGGKPETRLIYHSVLGAVMEGRGVCEGYSRLYQLLLNSVGVGNVYVSGRVSSGEHGWNLVKLDDGSYYNVDVTWDDAREDSSLFAVGKKSFTDHTADTPENIGKFFLCELPEIPDDDYLYVPAIMGDVNNDGKFNMKDYVFLQRYLNGWNVAIDRAASEVTGEGKLNMKDLVLLQRMINSR